MIIGVTWVCGIGSLTWRVGLGVAAVICLIAFPYQEMSSVWSLAKRVVNRR